MSALFLALKPVFALLAFVLAVLGFAPYFKGMFRGTVKPHAYTWFIWSITQATAAFGAWQGGGGYGALALSLSACIVFVTFLFTLRYGTKDVTRADVAILVLALLGVALWWFAHTPLLAVTLATAIDAVGYLPTYRKTFRAPESESMLTWGIFVASSLFGLLALNAYNPLTVMYLAMLAVANSIVLAIGFSRRARQG